MQRFEFRLQKALEWRETRLKEEEAKLARLRQEKENLVRLGSSIEAGVREAAGIIPGACATITGEDLAWLAECGRSAAARLKTIAAQITDCDSRIAGQATAVREADRQKQLLEDLRKEQFEEWNYAANRETEATAGELYLARWHPSTDKRD